MSGLTQYKQRYIRLTDVSGSWRVDPTLRTRIVEDARAEGSSMTSVVTRILANAYNVAYKASGRAAKPSPDQDVIVLRIPVELDRKIGMSAAAHDRKVQEEILLTLSAHYGLALPVAA